jgi:hypothetical protein
MDTQTGYPYRTLPVRIVYRTYAQLYETRLIFVPVFDFRPAMWLSWDCMCFGG